MTLNRAERAQTSRELTANLELSRLHTRDIQVDLGLTAREFEETLALGPDSRREAVWRLRDHLDQAIRANGDEPLPYSLL